VYYAYDKLVTCNDILFAIEATDDSYRFRSIYW